MDGGGEGEPFSRDELRLVDGLCQRWGQPPSAILAEPAGLILGMLAVMGDDGGAAAGPVEAMPTEDDLMRERLLNYSKVSEGA